MPPDPPGGSGPLAELDRARFTDDAGALVETYSNQYSAALIELADKLAVAKGAEKVLKGDVEHARHVFFASGNQNAKRDVGLMVSGALTGAAASGLATELLNPVVRGFAVFALIILGLTGLFLGFWITRRS